MNRVEQQQDFNEKSLEICRLKIQELENYLKKEKENRIDDLVSIKLFLEAGESQERIIKIINKFINEIKK